jgi:hypothetical protein
MRLRRLQAKAKESKKIQEKRHWTGLKGSFLSFLKEEKKPYA